MLHYDTEVVVIGLLILLLVLGIYFVPTIFAFKRKHQNKLGVFALNLFTGWTIIGWVATLVWVRKTTKLTNVDTTGA